MSGEILLPNYWVFDGKVMDLNKRIELIATGSPLRVGGLYSATTAANVASSVAPSVPAAASLIADTATMDATEVNESPENSGK